MMRSCGDLISRRPLPGWRGRTIVHVSAGRAARPPQIRGQADDGRDRLDPGLGLSLHIATFVGERLALFVYLPEPNGMDSVFPTLREGQFFKLRDDVTA